MLVVFVPQTIKGETFVYLYADNGGANTTF